jgi:trans-aconitate methyltransferase
MVEKRKSYAWNADDYAKHSSSQYEWAKELIPKPQLSGNEALLDIGCGDGKSTTVLAKSLPRGCVVGVDSSEDMVALARRTLPQDNYPNLSFQKMDARVLTFQEKFYRVFSNAALHWIIDHKSVLYGVQRSLKSGGRLLFQMGGKGNAHDILELLNYMLREEPWQKIFRTSVFPTVFTSQKSTLRGCLRLS